MWCSMKQRRLLGVGLCLVVFSVASCGGSPVSPSASTPEPALPRGVHPSLNSGNARWLADSGTLLITQDVTFRSANHADPDVDRDLEGFYWELPAHVRTVRIGRNVRVTGGFRLTQGQTIEGEDRDTSVIFGTATKAWARGPNGVEDPGTRCGINGDGGAVAGDDRVHDCAKWRYGAISVTVRAPTNQRYTVRNLTIENPRTYGITAFAQAVDVDRVVIKNTRPAPDFYSNSDGFGAGPGSTIRNSKIDTWDDAIKLYQDGMLVENVTVVHQLNGAPFQFGWSDHAPVSARIVNVRIEQAPGTAGQRFNLAPFSGSGGRVEPSVTLHGLHLDYAPGTTVNRDGTAVPMPLVFLKGPNGRARLVAAALNGQGPDLKLGVFAQSLITGSNGSASLEGLDQPWRAGLTVGNPERVTGCADCP